MNRFGLQDVNSIFLNLNLVLMNDLNIDIIEDIDIIDGSGILNIWGNSKGIPPGVTINNDNKHITIQIPDTRFKIGYEPVDFDIDKFLKLLFENIYSNTKHILFEYWFIQLMEDSFKYDNKYLGKGDSMGFYNFLIDSLRTINLKKLYQLLNYNQSFIRNNVSNIKVQNKTDFIYIKHKEINSKELNEKELQRFVDCFYYYYKGNLPFYVGYIFYMFYKKLHPNLEYNGIIGRMVFVENYTLLNHFPLSTFLQNVKCKYVEDIDKLFNIQQQIPTLSKGDIIKQICSRNQQNINSSFKQFKYDLRYFYIELNKEAVSKIILILLFSILYHQHQNDDNETKELLLEYFQDPFGDNPEFDNIKIKNFKEIREMINELDWNKKDRKRQK